MSVVVAYKKDGVVYMGADTQTTAGDFRINYMAESRYKIKRFSNGMLVGMAGSVMGSQLIELMKEIVDPSITELTKEYVVNVFLPKLIKAYDNCDLLEVNEDSGVAGFPNNILLALKDKLYLIITQYVVEVNDYAAIGIGWDIVYPYLYNLDTKKDIKKQLLEAMKASEEYYVSISGPYVFIDTKNCEYEIMR